MPRNPGSNRQRHDLIETVFGMGDGSRIHVIEFHRDEPVRPPEPVVAAGLPEEVGFLPDEFTEEPRGCARNTPADSHHNEPSGGRSSFRRLPIEHDSRCTDQPVPVRVIHTDA